MNRLGVVSLGLLAILSEQSLEAQRTIRQPSVAIQKSQQDVDFLRLYQEVSDLEKKLGDEPPETENRHYLRQYPSGDAVQVTAGPPRISDKVWEFMQERLTKFTSRYGLSFDKNSTNIFTSGKSLVIDDFEYVTSREHPAHRYVIFNEFSAIDARKYQEKQRDHHYSYQIIRSEPKGSSGFEIVRYPEVTDGVIPLFDTADFYGISNKIRELEADNEKFIKYEDSQAKGLNHDNSRALFAYRQLQNIGVMLVRMIEDSPDLNGLPIPKINMQIAIPRVAGNRIILGARSFGNLQAKWEDMKYELSLSGDLSLSIAPNGTVNYWFRRNCCVQDQTPVYRNLKINFPLK